MAVLLQIGPANAGAEGEELKKSNSSANTANECFEGVSRAMFKFNHAVDNVVFEPVARGYRVLPLIIRKGTGNAMDNLRSLLTLSNNILQGDFSGAGNTAGRFVINTTVGILGIWDPAASLGFEKKEKEDYGQTLGRWGVGPGCYVVLPIFGPSTVRDTAGTIANFVGGDPWFNVTVANDTNYFNDADYYGTRITSGIDF